MMKASALKSGQSGFTLVEVALAVLAIGLGLMTIIQLFPAGLQNAADDAADTRAGLFAEAVFGAIRGTATNASLTAWDDDFLQELTVEGMDIQLALDPPNDMQTVRFPDSAPDSPENYIRFKVSVSAVTGAPKKTYGVTLLTIDGRYGPFKTQNSFYTEYFYTGM